MGPEESAALRCGFRRLPFYKIISLLLYCFIDRNLSKQKTEMFYRKNSYIFDI